MIEDLIFYTLQDLNTEYWGRMVCLQIVRITLITSVGMMFSKAPMHRWEIIWHHMNGKWGNGTNPKRW